MSVTSIQAIGSTPQATGAVTFTSTQLALLGIDNTATNVNFRPLNTGVATLNGENGPVVLASTSNTVTVTPSLGNISLDVSGVVLQPSAYSVVLPVVSPTASQVLVAPGTIPTTGPFQLEWGTGGSGGGNVIATTSISSPTALEWSSKIYNPGDIVYDSTSTPPNQVYVCSATTTSGNSAPHLNTPELWNLLVSQSAGSSLSVSGNGITGTVPATELVLGTGLSGESATGVITLTSSASGGNMNYDTAKFIWANGNVYAIGDIATQNQQVFVCVVANTASSSGDNTVNNEPSQHYQNPPAWVSGTSYNSGVAVFYSGSVYVSTANANTTTPGSGGNWTLVPTWVYWQSIGATASMIFNNVWNNQAGYNPGDLVNAEGAGVSFPGCYVCIQAVLPVGGSASNAEPGATASVDFWTALNITATAPVGTVMTYNNVSTAYSPTVEYQSQTLLNDWNVYGSFVANATVTGGGAPWLGTNPSWDNLAFGYMYFYGEGDVANGTSYPPGSLVTNNGLYYICNTVYQAGITTPAITAYPNPYFEAFIPPPVPYLLNFPSGSKPFFYQANTNPFYNTATPPAPLTEVLLINNSQYNNGTTSVNFPTLLPNINYTFNCEFVFNDSTDTSPPNTVVTGGEIEFGIIIGALANSSYTVVETVNLPTGTLTFPFFTSTDPDSTGNLSNIFPSRVITKVFSFPSTTTGTFGFYYKNITGNPNPENFLVSINMTLKAEPFGTYTVLSSAGQLSASIPA